MNKGASFLIASYFLQASVKLSDDDLGAPAKCNPQRGFILTHQIHAKQTDFLLYWPKQTIKQ